MEGWWVLGGRCSLAMAYGEVIWLYSRFYSLTNLSGFISYRSVAGVIISSATVFAGNRKSPFAEETLGGYVLHSHSSVSEEDLSRAHLYGLLARFLAHAPDQPLLDFAAGLKGDKSPLGQALRVLARASATIVAEAADREYHDLFIGMGRGELVPFGSRYMTGFPADRPLSKLHGDMANLGIERGTEIADSEDHIAALCEIMAGLITGDLGSGHSLVNQRSFFESHLAPWAGKFFRDLEAARNSVLYTPIGTMGRILMEIETVAFEMDSE